jgi:acyl-CoA thioester hydrolase
MKTKFPIQIRFSDVDSLGHVNNAVYLSYFEMARMLFMHEHIGPRWDWQKKGMILKKNEVEYVAPVYLHEQVEIEIIPHHLGNTSFTLDYVLYANNIAKCKGRSVMVCFNFVTNEKTTVYDEFKALFHEIK